MTKVTTVKCKDHPTANNIQPQFGDEVYTLKFPLEDDSYLFVEMGIVARNAIRDMLNQQDEDDRKVGEDATDKG
jgi:hypothetical protein